MLGVVIDASFEIGGFLDLRSEIQKLKLNGP
jgi:hypothetical protein